MRLNSKFFISLLFFFSLITLESYSQNYLELKKATKLKSINFFEGENIRFKQKHDEIFTYAKITGIGSDYLSFNNIQIQISNIDIVDMKKAYILGFKIKLISEAYLLDNQIYCFSGPKLLDVKNSLYPVSVLLVFFNSQILFSAFTLIPAGINP